MPDAARTALACSIAGIDRSRFNDMVASGEYPCAPTTSPGKARVFELNDLVVLWHFGRLLTRGYPIRLAGALVARIDGQLKQKPEASSVDIGYGANGTSFTTTGDHSNFDASKVSGALAERFERFKIDNVREHIRDLLAVEARVLGED